MKKGALLFILGALTGYYFALRLEEEDRRRHKKTLFELGELRRRWLI